MRALVGCLLGSLIACAPAFAQSPTTPAHPSLPWALGPAIPQGQLMIQAPTLPGSFLRDVWIPAQAVVVDAMVALPAQAGTGAVSGTQPTEDPQYGVLRQNFTVPGYYVRETTVGFHYPERWVLDQSYTWRLVPAEFKLKSTVSNPGLPPAPMTAPSLGVGSWQPGSVPSLR